MLSDERMVLKGFEKWPDKKLEVLREAVGRKKEIERLRESVDPSSDKWASKPSIGDELQYTVDRFGAMQPTADWYMRNKEDLLRTYRNHKIPFEFKLVRRTQQPILWVPVAHCW